MLDDKIILITGGTGSFGYQFAETVLKRYRPRKLILFSRDEYGQHAMRQHFNEERFPPIRYFIGDVRDRERLYRAFQGVDIVVHAAALKQVPACEYNPLEAVKTNVLGAANVIDAAIDRGVARVIALSSDKAANPVNLYGASKLCADKLFIAANNYAGGGSTLFSVTRYGNVIGSRGSLVPSILNSKAATVPLTDERMTRFWITLEQAVEFVLRRLSAMQGGEIFVAKNPSMRVIDLIKALAPDCSIDRVGIRQGEKLHEVMVTEDDARNTLAFDDHYAIYPLLDRQQIQKKSCQLQGERCPEGFGYRSDTNQAWLSPKDLRGIVSRLQVPWL